MRDEYGYQHRAYRTDPTGKFHKLHIETDWSERIVKWVAWTIRLLRGR